ncbi:ferredoxin [Aestuariicoccus sp. MJ-SS9]|uniref:ferredoxin n=1 Tax=Aestuariicoccus sp. MJ-SS9 TaxID=3079855 RepID=UPI00290DFD63|nr:ferredoxin [Aestuariicoccus sp. MJ-SS9]MDU8912231.1 ferredoxin [Aestuariicoccus sp. MJ-SS9]
MTLQELDAQARNVGLALRGAFAPEPEDQAPEGCRTLLLLGPDEPGFWDVFTHSAERADGAPHPLDRWSKRVIGALAVLWGGEALFPYDGPPYHPFIRWARASGRAHASPVELLVHDEAGLFISYRGAVALPYALTLPPPAPSPCESCEPSPCVSACPVGALRPGAPYDVAACQAHVTSDAGAECRNGCLVRRACPVSQRFGRLPEQSAFHMAAFVKD